MSLAADNTLKADAPAAAQAGGSVLQDVLGALGVLVRSKGFWPIVLAMLGICGFFYPLIAALPDLWLNNDHYSHGFIIPVFSGYVLYKWWPRLKDIPVKPGYLALLFLPVFLVLGWAAMRVDQELMMSAMFLGAVLCTIWFLAGFRWLVGVGGPIAYLAFMLPVWLSIIDAWTVPLQLMSTRGAYHFLNLIGQHPEMDDQHPTDIYLGNFSLNVAVPCSGMKLLLAITAFTIFFLMIADLKWWAKLVMVGAILPLSLATNSLRIALIGVVGNSFGEDAGHQFHDYSGYLTLLLCFFVLFKLARSVGWTD